MKKTNVWFGFGLVCLPSLTTDYIALRVACFPPEATIHQHAQELYKRLSCVRIDRNSVDSIYHRHSHYRQINGKQKYSVKYKNVSAMRKLSGMFCTVAF